MTQTATRRAVAFQGEPGAYSELAALSFFGPNVKTLPLTAFEDVFKAVQGGKARFGIIPIENSLAGSIHQNYDLLLHHHLHIVGEFNLRVEHNLIANPGVTIRRVRRVFSHPQALMQCQRTLRSLKGVQLVPTYDTAGSVKKIKEEKIFDAAAVASRRAAEVYGMRVLRQQIQDDPANFTRFLVLARHKQAIGRADKTSIVFALSNVPGALFRSLSVFALRDIDLYKIESRPLHGKPWEYFFYIDFAGSLKDTNCRNAVNHLSEIATFLKILGSYQSHRTSPQAGMRSQRVSLG
ncbi:MAG: prephenate dehydratase [Acidobacteriota bacterium]